MKKIYKYIQICFIIVLCLFLGLSVIDTNERNYETNFDQDRIIEHIEKLVENGPRSIADKENHEKAIDYVKNILEEYGIVNEDTVNYPAYLVQDFVAEDTDYQNWYLKNIIVHIPANSSNSSNEALMFMGHTDSVPMGDGASDDGIACGVMLEAIRYYLDKMENGYTLNNDLVFCFVDGEEYGLYGSDAFMNEFDGFNDIVSRIRFGTNLESRGTDGTLIMFETAKNNYETIKLFSKMNKNVFTCSIATMIYDMMPNGTDFSNFKEAYQGLNFANVAGGEDYHTQNDNLENVVGTAHLSQQALIVDTIIDYLANYDLDQLYNARESAIFFSYLNIFTIVYNHKTTMILGVLLLGLVIFNVLFKMIYKKEHHFKQSAKSIIALMTGLILAAGATYVCYYAFQYIAVLLGHLDIHAVGTINYSNTTIIMGIGVLALAVTTLTSYLAHQWLKVEYRDLTRANAYIHAFLGIVLSFVLADASYLFVWSGLAFMMNEIIITMNEDFGNYHGELLITALYLPIVMPLIVLATTALGLSMAYVFGLIFALSIFVVGTYIAPKCNYFSIRKLLNKNNNTSVIEGILHITAIAMFMFLAVSMIKPDAHVNLQGKQGVSKLPYDDALVYTVNQNGEKEYRIYDLNAYHAFDKYIESCEYKDSYYVVTRENVNVDLSVLSSCKENTLMIKKTDDKSLIYLTFSDINASSFTIDDGITRKTYMFEDLVTYNITIHSDCQVIINDGTVNVEYKEVIRDYQALIPEAYTDEEKLHFNLWLTHTYKLK